MNHCHKPTWPITGRYSGQYRVHLFGARGRIGGRLGDVGHAHHLRGVHYGGTDHHATRGVLSRDFWGSGWWVRDRRKLACPAVGRGVDDGETVEGHCHASRA